MKTRQKDVASTEMSPKNDRIDSNESELRNKLEMANLSSSKRYKSKSHAVSPKSDSKGFQLKGVVKVIQSN